MGEISRRDFFRYTAGSGAFLAGGFGKKTVYKLIPYVIPPEDVKPGEWTLFATTCRECPAGCGMYMRHREGRVVNAMGNPEHPINKGGLCPRGQSTAQGLYDPDRLQKTLCGKCGRLMDDLAGPIEELGGILKKSEGKVTIISDLQTGALLEVMESFLEAFDSKGRLYLYEPFNYSALRRAHERLFGLNAIPMYHLDKADFIISFAADFLEGWVSNVQFARQFAQMHSFDGRNIGQMTYIGPRFSMTAANADEFVQVPAGDEYLVAMAMLKEIIEKGWARTDVNKIKPMLANLKYTGLADEKISQLADRFVHSKSSVALAGPVGASGEAAENLAIAVALLNYAAGRVGETVDFSQTHALGKTVTNDRLTQILNDLTKDDILIIHNANPAYSLQGAAENIRKAGTTVYVGTMPDETSKLAKWIFPADSPLESWGDYEPWTGINCLMQPTMARVFNTLSAGDIFMSWASAAGKKLSRKGNAAKSFEEWLKLRWRELHMHIATNVPFEDFWKESLRNGGTWETPVNVPVKLKDDIGTLRFSKSDTENFQLWAWSSVLLFDGRVSNRGWLQETAEPISSQVWGNIADINPKKAVALGLAGNDEIEIATKTGKIRLAVRITEDAAENIVGVSFGQGHSALGRLAESRGANVFDIIDGSDSVSIFGKVTIKKTGRKLRPVYLTATEKQHERELMQWVELSKLRTMKPGEGDKLIMPLPEGYDPEKDLYQPHEYTKHRWAMVIDLSGCIGCGACTVACQAENNIAVMGEDASRRWLEMTWLRIIPYRKQDERKRLGFLPMLCQHCDMAPCESVCPVFASVHNDEGLNAQVYNRCIGTRYCSNNCPYKVRRFNWLNVERQKPLNLQLNPDVTVRVRGVMEKCTFCIQRIRAAELKAKREHRQVRDGEIEPACLQSCPTGVFTFGDLLDPDSKVSRLTRSDPRRYHVLEELNTKPGITYLRRIKIDKESEDKNGKSDV
jgi:Fe-S-cluster-containing dehydrogenase component/anaerobic selenocysteine-containing dehydrogenase